MTSPSVVTLGETMALVRTTEIGSLRHANSLAFGIGGAESNVAIGLVRLGIPTSWLGRVGDDSLGERVAREIRGDGVDVRAIVDPDAATGLMVKERPSAASTAVHYYRAGSAGSRLRPEDLPADGSNTPPCCTSPASLPCCPTRPRPPCTSRSTGRAQPEPG